MKTNFRTRNRNSGFTLLELLLVMAILVVLAGSAGVAIFRMQTTGFNRAATIQVKTLKDACGMYKLNNNVFPQTLEDLIRVPAGMSNVQWGGPYLETQTLPLDPWKNAYIYSRDEANDRVFIRSAGKDGREGTEDDIPQQQQ